MKKYVAWIAIEADDTVQNEEVMAALLRGPLNELVDRGFITQAGLRVQAVKEGQSPTIIPPEMLQ